MFQTAIRQKTNKTIWEKSLNDIFWNYKEWEIIFLVNEKPVDLWILELEDLSENQKELYKKLENMKKEEFYNI
jgi:hypothetical protein